MNRRGSASIAANPVLVGAVTVLVAIMAVFLAYNANDGLPFVPTYSITIPVADGAELLAGNEVRVGGRRVGQVSEVTPVVRRGVAFANVEITVKETLKELPVDTRAAIRQRSNIGLKYVELQPGHSKQTIPEGKSLAAANVAAVTDLDDVLNAFDARTREGLVTVLSEFGDGVAGRGNDLNETVGALPSLTHHLDTTMTTLSSPRADLSGFINGLDAGLGAIAPVSAQLADAFDAGATTFGAIAPRDLQKSIEETAATEKVGTPALAASRPLLGAAANLLEAARPGLEQLPTAAPKFSAALHSVTPPLERAQVLADDIPPMIAALRHVSKLPDTAGAIDRLTDTLRFTTPALRFLGPMQTKCNYIAIWTRNVSSLASQGDDLGTWFRFTPPLVVSEMLPSAQAASDLHVVPEPDSGQNGQCEPGNENYAPGQQIGPVPGTQPGSTELTSPGTVYEQVAREGKQR